MHIIMLSRRNGATRSLHLDLRLLCGALVGVLLSAAAAGAALGSWMTPTVQAPEPHGAAQLLSEQLARIDSTREDAQRQLDAFSVHVADLQARLTRLDALGERLTELADLDASEFDFSLDVGRGGLEEPVDGVDYRPPSFMEALDELAVRLDSREQQLEVLEQLLADRRVSEAESLSGRPVRLGYVSSPFGRRSDPLTGRLSSHNGMDFAAKAGSEVLSVAAGVVTRSERSGAYGNLVEVSHADGYTTLYAHNKRNLVQVGDLVQRGQAIALVGSTGRSTGAHVHFEVRKDGRLVNPASYIARAGTAQ